MAAIKLYRDILKYKIRDVDKGYYADGEDAYDMCAFFDQPSTVDEKKDANEETKALENDQGKGDADNLAESNIVKEMNKTEGGAPAESGKKNKKKKGKGGQAVEESKKEEEKKVSENDNKKEE